ncbi:MAG: WD40 repeat domain-containing protein, partial [Planctomycetota bacterium]
VFTWDVSLRKRVGNVRRHRRLVLCVAYSPDGRYLATGSTDGRAVVWDVKAEKLSRMLEWPITTHVLAATFSSDGKVLALGLARKSGSSWKGAVDLWDVERGKKIGVLEGHKNAVGHVAFSRDGRWLATGSYDSTAALWDTRTGKMVRKFDGPLGKLNAVAFSPDGRYLASGTDHGTLAIWSARTGRAAKIVDPKRPRTYSPGYPYIRALAFSPDGHRLVVASDYWLRLWRLPKKLRPEKGRAINRPVRPSADQ